MEGQYGGQGQSQPFGGDRFVSSTPHSNGSVRGNPQNVYLTLDHYISPDVASPVQPEYQPFLNRLAFGREGSYNSEFRRTEDFVPRMPVVGHYIIVILGSPRLHLHDSNVLIVVKSPITRARNCLFLF